MAFFIQKILIFAAITTFAAADPGEFTLNAQFKSHLILLVLLASSFRFANCFGDHMVLQRQVHTGDREFQSLANVWGFIPEKDNVTLSFSGNPGFNTCILDCTESGKYGYDIEHVYRLVSQTAATCCK